MGVGGGKGSAPAPPNFQNAATPDQTNAFGASSKWTTGYDQAVPDWVNNPSTNSLDVGHGQQAADAWKQQHQHMSQTQSFGGPLGDLSKSLQGQAAGAWGTPLDNGAGARQKASDAIYGQETSRLDPQWQQRQHDMQTQLSNQGIDPNSAAYSTAMGNFDRGRNDAYQQANYAAVQGGGQEAQRQQQMDLTSRSAPMQALLGMSGLTGQGQNSLLPAAIAQYQGALQNYGINQQGKNSTMGGLGQLGGTLGSAALLA